MEKNERDHQGQEADTQMSDLLADNSNDDTGEETGLFDEDISLSLIHI